MTAIALFGARGKIGMRLGRNLAASCCETRHVEVSPAGRERVRQAFGVDCQSADQTIAGAEVVILAAVTFEKVQGVFSDACNKVIVFGKDTS